MNSVIQILGILLTITGFYDAYKYHWQAMAVKRAKTAKGQSRKGINVAIINDLTRISYLIIFGIVNKFDFYLLFSSTVALFCMIEVWLTIYKYYPYKYRNLKNFKRPNIFIYLINSLIPNNYRRRL